MNYPVYAKPTMCQHCGQYTTAPHWATKEFGRSTLQLAFCNKQHEVEYYMEKLQK